MKQNNKKQKILGIIIARGQSKRIPRKNLKLLDGKPLMSYAIKAALRSKIITDVIVSTLVKQVWALASCSHLVAVAFGRS